MYYYRSGRALTYLTYLMIYKPPDRSFVRWIVHNNDSGNIKIYQQQLPPTGTKRKK